MSGSRPSVFDQDLDLSSFAPKTGETKQPLPPENLEQVSEENGFKSREPKPRATVRPQLPKRPIAAKTGRTILLNARVTQRAHDRFHAIIESERLRYEAGELTHRVTLGEIVERALAALERELRQDEGE
jgi:hypothetical protein